jgi:ribosomal protein S18 acetylase RimI-like enzyme
MMMPWRPMTASDLPRVVAIAAEIHLAHPEDAAVLAERLKLYAAGCFVLEGGRALAGYTISHPWRRASPPALNARLNRIPANADTYYIHDVAVREAARRAGAASDIVAVLAAHATAAGFATMTLISVNDTGAFWTRLGFRPTADQALRAKLASYGADARLMVRTL